MMRKGVLVLPEARRRANRGPAASGAKELSAIVTERRMFEFHKPIRVTDREENGVWVHECKALNIMAYAETREESWRAFIDYFESDWDTIAQREDSRLTRDAQELKQEYLGLVKSVRPVL